jgi:NAD(P)-dependent dehydrogenase (short-subunit alcohol dehydrogenase family)
MICQHAKMLNRLNLTRKSPTDTCWPDLFCPLGYLLNEVNIMTSKWTARDMPDLTGKTAVVTGANSGIGYETARALAHHNALVTLACRNKDKGQAAVGRIIQGYPQARAELIPLDLSDLASVRRFAGEFTGRHDRLDILINNAGIMWSPHGKTADGFELQFGTNHLGHFALTGLLLDLIIHTPNARVITVSSWGERYGVMNFEDLNPEKNYDPEQAYGQSKLANMLFAYELQRRFEDAGVNAIAAAVHPGATATNLPASWTAANSRAHWRLVRTLNSIFGQKPEMGALPALFAATAPDVQGGGYYGPGSWGGLRGHPTRLRSGDRSYDTALASRLWTVSEELTGVCYHWGR